MVNNAKTRTIAEPLLAWFDRAGRHDLPWQHNPTPYRVWVSEIMLQQTRVTTVIPYFSRFTARFPDITSLAEADLDPVLHLWSGLGYYSRARNLHRAAGIVQREYGGALPLQLDALMELPGIGRSTAGAILSLGAGQRQPILDGNVKRVLSRYFHVDGWPGESRVSRRLWELAEQHTPARRANHYNQAMMDLGATLCTRTNPGCDICPVAPGCAAQRSGRQHHYPGKKPARDLPERSSHFLLLQDISGRLLLEKRPPSGIWGGLWCFPESHVAPEHLAQWVFDEYFLRVDKLVPLAPIQHAFSHFRLRILPWQGNVAGEPASGGRGVMEPAQWLWYNNRNPPDIGLARPVMKLLSAVTNDVSDAKNSLRKTEKTG